MKFLAFAAVALLFAGTTFAGDCGGGCGKKGGDKKDTVTTSVRL
jgi:hypothetical protein